MEFKTFIPKGILKEVKIKNYNDSYQDEPIKFSPLKLLSTDSRKESDSDIHSSSILKGSSHDKNIIHESSPILEKCERSITELGPFIRSRENRISKMFKEGDSNYYTFEGTDEVEYNQPKQLSSKECLKQENESLSNLRKSTSPARSETKIESQRYSKVDNTFCDNSYTEQIGNRNSSKVDMIRLEINELMEKMENASKSFFDSCDFANKNIEDPNIKIEEYSKNDSSILHSSKEAIVPYSKSENNDNKENKSINSNSVNCDYYILRNKYEMAMETIKEKEGENQSLKIRISELKQDLETIDKQNEIKHLEWKLEKSKLENKISLLESSKDIDKILPCYITEIDELQKKVLHLYKTFISKCDKINSEVDPLIKEEKQIRALKKQLQASLKQNEKLEKDIFNFK